MEEDNNVDVDWSIGETPFLATDIVRIEIKDSHVDANGEFDGDEVWFQSFTVERDGEIHEFGVDGGSKIKESGDGSNVEQGDSYFVLNDSVSPPSSGPFAGLDEQTYLFSSDVHFDGGPNTYMLGRIQDYDFNEDTDTIDPGEAGNANFNVQSAMAVCFHAGTKIATPDGDVFVETLKPGDLVITADHGPQPIVWIGSTSHRWSSAENQQKPFIFPVGALGAGLPKRDLVVSPQHRMLLPVESQKGGGLAPAKGMTGLQGVRQLHGRRFAEYIHLLFEQHEIIFAEGAPSESFFPGPMAMRNLSAENVKQVRQVITEPSSKLGLGDFKPARPFLTVKQAQLLITKTNQCWTHAGLQTMGLPLDRVTMRENELVYI
ncbi:MAG: Hint domain-containing protein [Rhodobacteraceae bacterium]|nr:Hint domain-containing protein [Paracoccaceae bacterium]